MVSYITPDLRLASLPGFRRRLLQTSSHLSLLFLLPLVCTNRLIDLDITVHLGNETTSHFDAFTMTTSTALARAPCAQELPILLANTGSARQYIDLGCLVFPRAGYLSTATVDVDGQWTNITSAKEVNNLLLPSELPFVGPLLESQWIRVEALKRFGSIILRVHLLPDDVSQSTFDRQSQSLRIDLFHLCSRLDVSKTAWMGGFTKYSSKKEDQFDIWATGIDHSLFWLFNKLPSPHPTFADLPNRYARLAFEEVFNGEEIPCLRAKLYPYQCRTVGAMIVRETSPRKELDPRFERRTSPTGGTYYYNPRDTQFRLEPPQFEGSRGGILAENMGVGKTVICIALILSTRFQIPRVPPQYSIRYETRPTTGSLSQMAISSAGKAAVSLKAHLHCYYSSLDFDTERYYKKIDAHPIHYEVPYIMRRSIRTNSIVPPPRRLMVCSTSIVVVPMNL